MAVPTFLFVQNVSSERKPGLEFYIQSPRLHEVALDASHSDQISRDVKAVRSLKVVLYEESQRTVLQ